MPRMARPHQILCTAGSALPLAGDWQTDQPVPLLRNVLRLTAPNPGVVMALFATLPYGKFAHGVYRCAALLKLAIEKRQPNRLHLGSD